MSGISGPQKGVESTAAVWMSGCYDVCAFIERAKEIAVTSSTSQSWIRNTLTCRDGDLFRQVLLQFSNDLC